MIKFSLKNKTVIVTGGGSGIGKAISKTFAKQGAKVHILDFNETSLKETVSEINLLTSSAEGYFCDVSIQKEVNLIIKKITEKNNIDILINNAGIAHVGNIESVEENDLDLLYNVNIKGIYNCIKATIPSMKK